MMNLNRFKNPVALIATSVAIFSLSPAVLAHNGHGHTQFDTLSGILHSLSTHPLLFGVVGLVFVTAAYMSHR